MATGTEKVIGFLMKSQRPLDEWYLNDGVAWADNAAALAGIPSGSRSPFKLINVNGTLSWFLADLTTLEAVTISSIQNAAGVSFADAGELYDAENVEDALAEVMSALNTLADSIGVTPTVNKNVFPITFGAYSSVSDRVTNAVETTNYPTDWILTASDGTNLSIVHNLTGRKLSTVNIWEIDGTTERSLPNFSQAYTGLTLTGSTIIIEGLAPTLLAIRISLLFE